MKLKVEGREGKRKGQSKPFAKGRKEEKDYYILEEGTGFQKGESWARRSSTEK